MSKVMVVAVHPDDETLGAGGTILKHKAQGDKIIWLIMTTMPLADYLPSQIKERQKEIEAVQKAYGFDGVIQLGLPAAHLDELSCKDLVKAVSEVLRQVKPEILYLPFVGDAHSDHRIVAEAAHSALKIFRNPSIKRIYMMETLSETEFGQQAGRTTFFPNYFVDVSGYMDRKFSIMKKYKSELGKHPFPRSKENIYALATYRGAMTGCRYAESFMIMREIW